MVCRILSHTASKTKRYEINSTTVDLIISIANGRPATFVKTTRYLTRKHTHTHTHCSKWINLTRWEYMQRNTRCDNDLKWKKQIKFKDNSRDSVHYKHYKSKLYTNYVSMYVLPYNNRINLNKFTIKCLPRP